MTTYAPRYVRIHPYTKTFSEVGTWTRLPYSTNYHLGMGIYYSGNAQNDEVVWNVALDAGTWSITTIYARNTAYGIGTYYLDSTSVGTVDYYGAATANNVSVISGISVATAAVYAFKIKAETKNASASAYGMGFQFLEFTRTGS